MKPKTALILVAVLALIFGAVAINKLSDSSKTTDTGDGQKDAVDKTIFPVASSGFAKLVIAPRGEQEIVFSNVLGTWMMVQPVQASADVQRITRVKDLLFADMAYQRIVAADDEDSADAITGLNAPRWVVTMVDQVGDERMVKIGRSVPQIGTDDVAAYVRVGDTTYVVAEDFTSTLRRPVSEYRSKKVFAPASEQIVSVSIAGRENYDLAKTDDAWSLTRPVKGVAQGDKVTDLLGKITGLSIDDFTDDSPTSLVRYGLDKPVLTVKITAQMSVPEPVDPTTQPTTTPASKPAPKPPVSYGVAFGAKTDENKKVFARMVDGGGVFTVPVAALGDLQPALLSLRDKTVAKINAPYAKTIEMDIRGAKASMLRTGHEAKWTVSLPQEGRGDKAAIDNLIKAMGDLKATNFVDAPNAVELRGLATPRARITLTASKFAGGESVTILVGDEGPDGVAVMREGSGVVLVGADDVKTLLAPPASYWDPTLLDIGADPDEKITLITVTRPDEEPIKLMRHTTGDWLVAAPVAADADSESVITLLDRVEKLTATRIAAVGPNAHAPYARSRAKIVIDVTTGSLVPTTQPASQPATQPATTQPATTQPTSQPAMKTVVKNYRINVVLMGIKAYAWVDGREVSVVGEFEMNLYNKELTAEFRKRGLWEFAPDDVVAVTIRPGKQEHVLRRQADSWRYTASSLMKIDAEKVTAFLKDVSELKVQRFVQHKTPATPEAMAKFLAQFGLDQPWLELVVTTSKGQNHRIVIASAGTDKTTNRYAAVDGVNGVFILSAEDIGKLSKLPEDFEKK